MNAKERGLTAAVRPDLLALGAAGFRIAGPVVRLILDAADE